MTNVFKYNFGPTRALPIGSPVLNLPGSFSAGFDGLMYQGGALIDWAFNNWIDILLLAFAGYGGLILIPRMFTLAKKWTKKVGKGFFT